MKNFWKHGLLFLFILVVVGSLLGSSTESERKSNNMSDAIVNVEEHLSNSQVIEDGILKEEAQHYDDGNFFANAGETIGGFIINVISTVLESFARLVSKMMG